VCSFVMYLDWWINRSIEEIVWYWHRERLRLRLVIIHGRVAKGQEFDRLFGKVTGGVGEGVHSGRGVEELVNKVEELGLATGGLCHCRDEDCREQESCEGRHSEGIALLLLLMYSTTVTF